MMSHLLHKTITSTLLLGFFLMPVTMYAQTSSTYQPRTQLELIAYLYGVLTQLQAQLAAQQSGETPRTSTSYTTRNSPNPFYVNVISLAPTTVGRTVATLKAEVDKGGSEYLDVWFEYGEGSRLNQKESVAQVKNTGRQSVSVKLDDLDSDTTYSFRIVVEDEDGHRQYGQTRTFTTIADALTQSFSGRPTAETEGATDIRSTGADIQGFISMNDYETGMAFFVYGANRSNVIAADEYDSYQDIPVSETMITKQSVNSSFTGRNTVKSGTYNLKPATRYYYRACVEYYEEDDKTDPAIRCGEAESFTTLN
jgi:hypothetical protein